MEFSEKLKNAEEMIEVLFRLLSKTPSSPLKQFVKEDLTGRKRDMLELVAKGINSQAKISEELGVSGSAVRKYIAECNMAFREFIGMEENSIELITSPSRGEGWELTMLGSLILSIKKDVNKMEEA